MVPRNAPDVFRIRRVIGITWFRLCKTREVTKNQRLRSFLGEFLARSHSSAEGYECKGFID
jgi:hypothetical protein